MRTTAMGYSQSRFSYHSVQPGYLLLLPILLLLQRTLLRMLLLLLLL